MTRIKAIEGFRRFQTFVVNRMVPPAIIEKDSLTYWRVHILFAILFTGLVLCFFALILFIALAIKEKLWGLAIFNMLAYLSGVGLLLSRRPRYKIRAAITLLMFYLVGLAVIVSVGPLSGGPAWLFAFVVLVGVLLGARAAIAALGLNAITLTIIGWLMITGRLGQTHPFFNTLEAMVVAGANFILLNAVAAVSVAELVKGLVSTHQKEKDLTSNLERERAHLMEAKEKLELEIEERVRAEENLRLLSSAMEQSTEGIAVVDLEGNLLFVNEAFATMHGYSPLELVGKHLSIFHTPEQMPAVESANRQIQETGQFSGELWHVRRDGTVFPTLMQNSLLRGETDNPIGMIGALRDITERKRTEERLKASLREKGVLLKEIHHRVKNNLQLISSLLDLQTDYVQNPQALVVFKESQNRIKSMALVHEQLYQSPDLGQIDFAEYVRDLTVHLFHSYGVTPDAIALVIDADDVLLDINTAIPYGLIINELLSNSLKHAFPPLSSPPNGGGTRGGRACEICIGLHRDDERLTLVVSDNGVGFPPDLDFRNTDTLGLQLVTMLIHQLEGTIELDRNRGTTFKIRVTTQPGSGTVANERRRAS